MKKNPYRAGLEPLCAAGVVKPTGDRVLLRAILATDGSDFTIHGYDTKKAVCHEVVDIGPAVKWVERGEHVLHISTAGDSPDWEDKTARYVLVREDDIVAYWDPQKAMEVDIPG